MDINGYAIVVGGGGGIGRATAVAFAQAGVSGLLITDINLETARSAASEAHAASKLPGFRAEARAMDITSQEAVETTFQYMVDTFGRIDYCVNCAGIPVRTPRTIDQQVVSEFVQTQDVNVNGMFFVLRAAIAIMKTQEPKPNLPGWPSRGNTRGSIVALGSGLSVLASPYFAQYTTSKHAVVGLVRTAALDCVKDDIRVNCVCPSWVETPMAEELRSTLPDLDGWVASHIPMGRMAAPEEVADAIVFLCSPRASLITAITLMTDGGASASA